MSKFIFITGGVVSSLGKGLAAAAIGLLLRGRGLNIAMQKLDPYINIDPGKMDPLQHGEVYVTDDGAEGDLDLGHYERFAGVKLTRHSNITTGRIYQNVIAKERRGDYGGRTVQIVPHITDYIKEVFISLEKPDIDVVIVELGGTVGDIESLPYIEAFRQFSLERPEGDVIFTHLTLVPYLLYSKEIKTKPTQHSVQKLREYGIQPDILICRTEVAITKDVKNKIAMFCNVRPECVIDEKNAEHTVYEVPIILHKQGVDKLICELLALNTKEPKLDSWQKMLEKTINPKNKVKIAVVGKQFTMADCYKSIKEALFHGGIANDARVEVKEVDVQEINENNATEIFNDISAILIPDNIINNLDEEDLLQAITYARVNDIPFLGIGSGMHLAVLEYARNVCNIKDAIHTGYMKKNTVFDKKNAFVSALDIDKQPHLITGIYRKGLYACQLKKKSRLRQAYDNEELVRERHRNEFEVVPDKVSILEKNNLIISGINPDSQFVEAIEIGNHKWFIAVIYRPEFLSRPVEPHPIFKSFIAAALNNNKA